MRAELMTVNHLSRLVIRVLLVGYAAIILTACSDTSERGPYLQNPSSTTMVVRWRATGESTATVRYGASPKALNNIAESNSDLARGKFFAYDHEVLLVNLVPETRYYYRVSGLADDVYSLKTPPVEGVARPTDPPCWPQRLPSPRETSRTASSAGGDRTRDSLR